MDSRENRDKDTDRKNLGRARYKSWKKRKLGEADSDSTIKNGGIRT